MDEKEFEGLTPDQAKGKIAEVMGTPNHPYFDGGNFRHKEEVSRMGRLHDIAYGAEAQPEDAGIVEALKKGGIESEEDVERAATEPFEEEEKKELEGVDRKMREVFGDQYEEVASASREGMAFAAEEIPELRETLEKKGPDGEVLGNNPEVVKIFAKLGRVVKKAQGGGAQ